LEQKSIPITVFFLHKIRLKKEKKSFVSEKAVKKFAGNQANNGKAKQ